MKSKNQADLTEQNKGDAYFKEAIEAVNSLTIEERKKLLEIIRRERR